MTDKETKQKIAQARIATIESEKKFLSWLLTVPFDIVVTEIINRLREADVQIGLEQKSISN